MAKSLNLSAKNIVQLNHTHLFLRPFMSKIFKLSFVFLGKISSELYKFHAIHLRIP